MKSDRQNAIIDLIEKYDIETHQDMISHLSALGYDVTQATVSRDIRELQLTKATDGINGYFYALPANMHLKEMDRLNHSLTHLIESVKCAANIIVIKTKTGMAQAVATGIDNIKSEDILGCVAGDDTIFVVVNTNDNAAEISEKIKDLMVEA